MKTQNETTTIAKYNEVIEQIHTEFETAHEVLLEQAKKIITGTDDKVEKASRLKKAGFDKATDVKENEHEVRIKTLAEQTAKIVDYYSRKYPLFKFITPDQTMTIAEKYNLVLGNVSDFIGFVPDKNLKEIEKFKCDEKDKDVEYARFSSVPSPCKLKIVAPEKDFDMTGKEVRNRKVEIKDPIVLQPVKYGYLILTAWGDEASDPIVVNQINN
jgi:hypothetical protein